RGLPDRAARAFEVARVEEQDQRRIDSMRWLRLDVLESGKERVHRGQGRRDEHPYLFAFRAQRFSERKTAAEGVAIGVLMTEDQDLLIGVNQVLDLVIQIASLALRLGYDVASLSSAPSCGSTSFNSSLMC